MILKMKKYSFLVYHKQYIDFLDKLRELGVLHVVEKQNSIPENDKLLEKMQFASRIKNVIKQLEKYIPKDTKTEKQEAEANLEVLYNAETLLAKKAQIHAEAIAEAISEKEDNKKKFKIVSDEGIQPLYSIAKDPTTGEVYTIDNQESDPNARIKKSQVQSIEEAEQDLKLQNLEIL